MNLLLVFILMTSAACCCMCSGPVRSAQDSFERSEMVFVGTVSCAWTDAAARLLARFKPVEKFMGDRRVRLEVQESFRGSKDRHIIVSTGYTGCTHAFFPGEIYLVYAFRDPDSGLLYTSTCTRTGPATLMKDDLRILRKGK
jgi:hypothetical protein